ncbi:superoxide dismutase [Longispora sp. NPDC051575]|uniref:superoxide dismutase n=1 Tax=Longispora sp. NPDC051575 TaxID=3154943 RepID=UPI003444BF81
MKRRQLLSTLALAGLAGALAPAAPAAASRPFDDTVPLPDGFAPEGIAIRGATFWTGSVLDGRIYRGDLVTGHGAVLTPGTEDGIALGVHVDAYNRVWVARGYTGDVEVLDGRTGLRIALFHLTDDLDNTFVNDLVITRDAVYLTDSGRPYLYVVPLGPGGRLPAPGAVRALPLTGGAADPDGFNNGIEVLPNGHLILVQMYPGTLWTVDPRTGASTAVDTGGATFVRGDGLLLRGLTLHVCQNLTNRISVVDLDPRGTRGRVRREITDPRFDSPATIAAFGPYLYATNAKFATDPTPTTKYELVRVRA